MSKQTEVKVRGIEGFVPVVITDEMKPLISDEVLEKWQNIVNIIAKIIEIPSGLIMQLEEDTLKVMLKSDNITNPFVQGTSDSLGHGVYCETVIGTNNPLEVPNALESKVWKGVEEISLDMISYYGLPVKWPDGNFFGTICVMDNKANNYSDLFKQLLDEFRKAMENDLALLLYKEKLEFILDHDSLTTVLNRRKLEICLHEEYERFKRSKKPFSVMLMDIDKFKSINDTHGHVVGDQVLKGFAALMSKSVRVVDAFGRWGGDEFLLLCYDAELEEAEELANRLAEKIAGKHFDTVENITVSIGVAAVSDQDNSIETIINRADQNMYQRKRKSKELKSV